jgi:tetratricopeptide (TPR) repeat protein
MIDENGNAKIMDFGIARSLKEKGITGAGVMIGTPEYMSPEQVEGKEVDQRSDIYSLGVILYEMVTGRVPFEGDTALTIAVKHKTEEPKNPKEFNTQLADDLVHVILRCLDKDKSKRYQSVDELRSELENIEKDIPSAERVIPKRKPLTSKEITVHFSVKKALVPALVVIAVVVIGLVLWQLIPKKDTAAAPKIENSVAVITFENLTGDSSLDHLQKVIPNLLITNLENTGLFYVPTWERMSDLLRQIENRDVDIIDSELGFKLCQKEGIESIVVGSYAKAGNVFVTDVKIQDVETRKLIKSASSTGEGIDSILRTQINDLSRTIAEGLGIAREKIDTAPLKIENVATNSLEAYRLFIQGDEAEGKWNFVQALKFYEKATEIDPNFAYAYRRQAEVHRSLRNAQEMRESLEKAKSLSHHATEKQRLYIEAAYARTIERDTEKMLRIYQEIAEKFPKEKGIYYNFGLHYYNRDFVKSAYYLEKALELDPNYADVCNQLAYVYLRLDRDEEAIELFERYVSLSPENPNALDSLADAYFHTGRIDESITKYIEITEIYPEFYSSNLGLSYIYALKEDFNTAIKWIDQFIFYAPSLVLKGEGSLLKSFYLSWLGRFEAAFKELQIAANLAEAAGDDSLKAQASWTRGDIYFDQGKYETSRRIFKSFLDSRDSGRGIVFQSYIWYGLLDIRQGFFDPAKSPLGEMESRLSEMTANQDFYTYKYDYFRAEVLLAEKRYDEAIDQFSNLVHPEYWPFAPWMVSYNFPALKDVSARAYAEKGDIDGAIAEYRKLITFDPRSNRIHLIHPLNHYRLAVLLEQKGDRAGTVEQYEKFLELWKDADEGLPEVEDAKKRLATLQE